jgi:hypothetical protein
MYSCITPTVTCNEEPSWKITPFKNFNSKSLHRFFYSSYLALYFVNENILNHAWSGSFFETPFHFGRFKWPCKKIYSIDWLAKQISINSYLCVRYRKCLCISWSNENVARNILKTNSIARLDYWQIVVSHSTREFGDFEFVLVIEEGLPSLYLATLQNQKSKSYQIGKIFNFWSGFQPFIFCGFSWQVLKYLKIQLSWFYYSCPIIQYHIFLYF